MGVSLSEYLFATVAYADIFDYPLTADDIYFWCIKKYPGAKIRAEKISGVVGRNYVFTLRGRQHITETYTIRRGISKNKREKARAVAKWLRLIPSLTLVGVTGGVAVDNAVDEDDIDLFFITARKTLWITRLLITLLISLMGIRRKPGDRTVKNKICLNMFMSEDALGLPKKEQDLYAAHEVLQMAPLWARGNSYKQFLESNNWVKRFLPVAWEVKRAGHNNHPKASYVWTAISVFFLRWLEKPAKSFQLWYMQGRHTREVIKPYMLRFHPEDARYWIRREFGKRLLRRNIPLDNIFYDS
jgi:hypothetical protein